MANDDTNGSTPPSPGMVPLPPGVPVGSIPLVMILKAPDGQVFTVWGEATKAALRHLIGAAEDLRENLYAPKEQSKIVVPTPTLIGDPFGGKGRGH